jgi:hypothetical protein
MRKKIITLSIFIAMLAVISAACSKTNSSSGEQIIKSAKSGNLTVTLSNATGELKNGENDLFISFADASGKLVDVGAAALNFHMAGMGTMAEMNDKATLTTTDIPGKYRAKAEIEMASTWEAVISYEGSQGKGQAVMTVNVK